MDGTESLISGRDTWWVSVGLLIEEVESAGLIFQPSTGRWHDSSKPQPVRPQGFNIGLSPDRIDAKETATVRERLEGEGAHLINTPHAAEKIAAVLEGRAVATVYLASPKSPSWHSWDLAAAVALARSNGLLLRTLDGRDLRIDVSRVARDDEWICATDEESWDLVRKSLR